MPAGANGRGKPNGQPGIRTRFRQMRATLTEGLKAALRADPEVLENCKPKTGYGQLVRGMLLEAAKGKTTPLKAVMSLIDGEGEAPESGETEDVLDETRRDWSADGVWQTFPESKGPEEEAEDDQARDDGDGPAKKELLRRLERLMLGDEADRERAVAVIRALHTGNFEQTNGGPGP